MISHTSVIVGNFEKAKEFYTKALAPLGYAFGMELPEYKVAGYSDSGQLDFWIGEKANPGGIHVAFAAKSKEQVDEFYKVALEAGAADNGAPGYRKEYSPGYYGAFVFDPDGNNIEAVWMDSALEQ